MSENDMEKIIAVLLEKINSLETSLFLKEYETGETKNEQSYSNRAIE